MTSQPPLRYAHSEGHIDITYNETGNVLVTCGSDGDVRIYKGFEDDDPESHRAGDCAYSVLCKKDKFYVGSDDNSIQAFDITNGEPGGIIARFTAPVTHIHSNEYCSVIVAGACDFTVKHVDLDSNKQRVLQEHVAPVLSVALHPSGLFVASSSCDGTIKIFNLEINEVVKIIDGLKKCNDFSSSTTLCRLCWDNTGKFLLVPINQEILVYDSDSWNLAFTLSDESIRGEISVLSLSPCGKYVVAGCRDGAILVWNLDKKQCILRENHKKKLAIGALAWNPKQNGRIAYADREGQLGILENSVLKPGSHSQKHPELVGNELDDLFDDGDDDVLIEASNPTKGNSVVDNYTEDIVGTQRKNMKRVLGDDDDDDSRDFDLGKIKAETMGEFIGDNESEAAAAPEVPKLGQSPPHGARGFEPTPIQRPFQSSSTPTHLSNRFMVWNNIGIITQYDTDEEQSISIEFHDTATHHALYLPNNQSHTMGDLSSEAAVLAGGADEDSPSKLVCHHFGSWDSNKEWSVSMPDGEEVVCVCLGDGWIAAGTDTRLIRLFSVGGIQKEIISVPGPVIAISGHSNQLFTIYHRGMGLPGDQYVGFKLVTVSDRKKAEIIDEDLPISPKSIVSWIGFSAEGTPVTVDSLGVIRILNRSFGGCWTPICNMKSHCKGKSDNYWIVSIHENPEQIRAILCKGARYPPTLPKPNVVVLPYKLPLCEMSTEKGSHEESYWRNSTTSQHFDWWALQGFEYDEFTKNKKLVPNKEALMKLFAIACKSDHEYRAVELCEMMSDAHTIQLAIKYASRLRRMQLAEKLTEVARRRVEEETAADYIEEDKYHMSLNSKTSDENVETANVESYVIDGITTDASTLETGEANDPILSLKRNKEAKIVPRSLTNSQKAVKNPFKVTSQKSQDLSTGTKGSSVFDNIDKNKAKLFGPLKNASANQQLRQKETSQRKLFSGQSKPSVKEKDGPTQDFQNWFESNKKDLQMNHPDLSEVELTVEGAKAFKDLSKKGKKDQKNKLFEENELRKRKRSVDEFDVENHDEKSTKLGEKKIRVLSDSTSSKLAGFSFSKD